MQQRQSPVGDYNLLYTLGSGSTGKVKLAQHIVTGNNVAIKIIKKSLFEKNPDLQRKVQREIALMRLFDHPHLLKLIEVCESTHHYYIIMEYAPNGELFDFLVQNRTIETENAMQFFRQIIYGLEFLHSHAICHRDLKPENILLDENKDIKIADFGFARWMKSNIAETYCGSPHYAAPEVIRGIPYDGRMADIWSCGVILFALLAGRLPFNDPAIRNLLSKVKAGQYVMPNFPPEIQDLISRMLTVDVNQRINIEGIKEHPAFRIGLPESYILPCPLPIPFLPDPIDLTEVDPKVLAVLQQIGFTNDEELQIELGTEGHSMAKVFYYMLTTNITLDSLPWTDNQIQADISAQPDAFLMSPQGVAYESGTQSSDPFHRRRRKSSLASSPDVYSLAERAQWASVPTQEYTSDIVQPCVDINMHLDILMMNMQLMLYSLNFEWFHQDDYTLIARRAEDMMYIIVKVAHESATETLQMNLYFTQATQQAVQIFLENVRCLLTNNIE